MYKGLAFCVKCGHFGSVRLKNLAFHCVGVPTKYGRAVLESIRHDKLPKNVARWPEDEALPIILAREDHARSQRHHAANFLDPDIAEALEADLIAGMRSSNTNVSTAPIPLANASTSSSSNPNNVPHELQPAAKARRIMHKFDDEDMSQQSEPSDY